MTRRASSSAECEGSSTTSRQVSLRELSGRPCYISRMAVDPALLEILVCPECKKPVRVVKDGAGAALRCVPPGLPVKDDIPVMLVDEATIEY